MFLNINYNKIRGWVSVINEGVLHQRLEIADTVTFTDKILNGKFHFLCSCDILTQVVGVNCYWDKLLITFNLHRCFLFQRNRSKSLLKHFTTDL